MKYPRYPKYKDSGVEWVGEVPEGWTKTPFKHATNRFSRGKAPAYVEKSSVQVVNQSCVHWSGFSSDNVKYHDETVAIPDRLLAYDDLLINSTGGGTIGRSCLFNQNIPAFADSHVTVLRCNTSIIIPSFIKYYFTMPALYRALVSIYAIGSTNQIELSRDRLINSPCFVPCIIEQQAIAAFLDHETTQIDALIAEQEKLITLLREKRQAVISQAVTKGLNPDAPMKDSGVEWLGKVPKGWNITRLKFVTEYIIDCPHETPIYSEDGEYLVIRTADISAGCLDTSHIYRLEADEYQNRIRRRALSQGDIVYGREGERWGFAAVVPHDNLFCLGQRMMQFIPSGEINSFFLMWQLNSQAVYKQGAVDTVGATSPHVNVWTIKNYSLTLPPLSEQYAIIDFLETETAKIDALIAEAKKAVELLKERRSAVISAAVTGKIYVRDIPLQEAV